MTRRRRKTRGPVPSLIGGTNGRPRRVSVQGKSKCSRCHVPFAVGDTCITIPKLGGAYSNDKRVCNECFQEILKKTSEDLDAIKKDLGEHWKDSKPDHGPTSSSPLSEQKVMEFNHCRNQKFAACTWRVINDAATILIITLNFSDQCTPNRAFVFVV